MASGVPGLRRQRQPAGERNHEGSCRSLKPYLGPAGERQRRQLGRRDEARTEWIGGVSHDIRTPLSLVMGYADMIESQPETEPEVRKKAALIRKQSLRIRDLIEDLNPGFQLEIQYAAPPP
ncbi:MAG: sensor histidine kinase [Enterocloster sp.]